MNEFPHVYTSSAAGVATGPVLKLTSPELPEISVSAPVQFGGPSGFWNPEAFFSAAVSSCFILTFNAVARAMKLEWVELDVDVKAYLDKVDGKLSFTKVEIFPHLRVPAGVEQENYLKALHKAEQTCLITNSINAKISMMPTIS